jgi:predicted transcriptional regulator
MKMKNNNNNNINKKCCIYSIQKKRNKIHHREETLQKAKHNIINKYYDIIDDLQYEAPYINQWNQIKIIVGIWNDKENKIEFTDDLLQNLNKKIQILSNPVE